MGVGLLVAFLALQVPAADTGRIVPHPRGQPPEASATSPAPRGAADSARGEFHAGGLDYERVSDLVGFNRVEGLSAGLGIRIPVERAPGTDLHLTARYGFSDRRVSGRAALARDAWGGRVTLAAYRDLADADPVSPGRTLSNSVNALLTGHDDGSYLLATGGEATWSAAVAPTLDLSVTARLEHEGSVSTVARSTLNDMLGGTGDFPSNPAVLEGGFARLEARVERAGRVHWLLRGEGLSGEGVTAGRAMGELGWRTGDGRGLFVGLRAGIATGNAPPQFLFRLGGGATVRGFEYATRSGTAFWAARADLVPFGGSLRPVLFADLGQADRAANLFHSTALVGAGGGIVVYSPLLRATLLRINLSHAVNPDRDTRWRLDLAFSSFR